MALIFWLALFSANAALIGAEFTCDIDGHLNDCGKLSDGFQFFTDGVLVRGPIDEGECLRRDCCWHEFGSGSEEPWCFYKNAGYEYCANHLYRSDCGELETTEWECAAYGCCWNERYPYPSCFFPNSDIDQRRCDIPISDRVACAYGTNQDTDEQDSCEEAGCCWYPLEHGSAEPWCYIPLWSSTQQRSSKHSDKHNKVAKSSQLVV